MTIKTEHCMNARQIDDVYRAYYGQVHNDTVITRVTDKGTVISDGHPLKVDPSLKAKYVTGGVRLSRVQHPIDLIRHEGVFPTEVVANLSTLFGFLQGLAAHIRNTHGATGDMIILNTLRLPGNSHARYSRHLLGLAADICVEGLSMMQLRNAVISFGRMAKVKTGVIMYQRPGSRNEYFVHVDILRANDYHPTSTTIPA